MLCIRTCEVCAEVRMDFAGSVHDTTDGNGTSHMRVWHGWQCAEVPDILCLPHCVPFSGRDGDPPGFEHSSERARALLAAACSGTDAPLSFQLPHARALTSSRKGVSCSNIH